MKNIKAPKIVTIGVLTLITLVFWVAFEVFRTFTKTPELTVLPAIIEPINPTLDQSVLSKLQGKMYLDEGQIGQTVTQSPTPAATIAPTVAPTASPVASSSAQPSASPSETVEPGATP